MAGPSWRGSLRFGLLGILLTVFVCMFALTRVPLEVDAPDVSRSHTASTAQPHLSAGTHDPGTLDDDLPDGRQRLKELLGGSFSTAKKETQPRLQPPALGNGSVYAGIRASAGIPADRVRQTALDPVKGFYLRAPPACG